uniref:Uncharacterized protein n=1 Tax=Oryza nivara TaxID=4536 RepID=A0A0E0IYC2_ORYNI
MATPRSWTSPRQVAARSPADHIPAAAGTEVTARVTTAMEASARTTAEEAVVRAPSANPYNSSERCLLPLARPNCFPVAHTSFMSWRDESRPKIVNNLRRGLLAKWSLLQPSQCERSTTIECLIAKLRPRARWLQPLRKRQPYSE